VEGGARGRRVGAAVTHERGSIWPVLGGFVVLWLVLDRSSAALGSLRGEYGAIVCAAVLAAALVVERLVTGRTPRESLYALGLVRPRAGALVASVLLCAVMLLLFPVFEALTGARLTWRADAVVLALGMFAQGGIAEEVVFRGFLFRHLRPQRTFWRAALLASLPFIAVHLPLLASLEWPLALASIALSVALSFPLAWLFERSGGSVWPPALLHAVVQAAIKLVDAGASFQALALVWMALSATLPWTLFLLRDAPAARSAQPPRDD
jgi:membrane protease YdiL (CAAX protease family)